MKLKLDDKGNVVLENGLPVWVSDDGKEIAFDVPKLVNDLKAVNAESAGRRKEIEALTEKLSAFDGIDVEKAKRGMDLATLYDEGKLKDAGKVEEIRAAVEKSFQAKFDDQEKRLGERATKAEEALENERTSVKRMMVKGLFDSSVFLKEKTLLPADVAFAYFGAMVDVEEQDGERRVIGKINGQPIFSRKEPGKIASGDDIIEAIVDAYPMKERILVGAHGGSGAPSNGNRAGGANTIKRSQFDAMNPADKAAHIKGGGVVVDG